MIEVRNISKSFGGVKAVNNASIHIKKGTITGLIGPNGAGKTTLFNIIAGDLKPTSGQILLDGEDITGLEPYQLYAKGLLRTFQLAHEFSTLSVMDNLMVAGANQSGESFWTALFLDHKVRKDEERLRERAFEVATFLKLGHLLEERAGNLSGGQKKLLELGRTMMSDAKVVLLDEVGAGVNRTLLGQIGDAILELNQDKGYTFCMIEHDIDFITRLCDPVIVMAEGAVLAQGKAHEVKNDSAVIDAYLGRGRKVEAEQA